MRPALEGRPGTALVLAGLLVVSVLIVIQFTNLSPITAGPPGARQPGGGANPGNTTQTNNFGGRFIARFLLQQSSKLLIPIRGITVQIDANTTAGTIRPKPLHIQTNGNGYAFAQLVEGPYILSVVEQGWSLIGSFNMVEGRTTDFNVTVKAVTIPVAAYDIQDPDSSSTLGPWATMAVSLPKEAQLSVNQTAYFETTSPILPTIVVQPITQPVTSIAGPLYVNIRNGTTFPSQNSSLSGGPSTSAAVVTGVFPYSSGQWVTLQPLGTMSISQFSQAALLVYEASYRTQVMAN